MKFPILIINLKNYKEGSGKNVEKFFKYASKFSKDGSILVAPPILDTLYYVNKYRELLIAQTVDVLDYGSSTGHIPLKRLFDAGIRRSLINHSEYKLPHELIKKIVIESVKIGFETVVCVDSIEELNRLIEANVKPTAYAIEPPELIGSGKSVSKYKPYVIEKAVEIGESYGVPILCGAGVSNGEDVKVAIELGAMGVLVASAVVKAKEPKNIMQNMLSAIY